MRKGVDGVLIFPGDSVMVAEPIKNIFNAENIPVVITDIGSPIRQIYQPDHHRQLQGRPAGG